MIGLKNIRLCTLAEKKLAALYIQRVRQALKTSSEFYDFKKPTNQKAN
jgi:hypothetical protein